MGGAGSGYRGYKKTTVEQCARLVISDYLPELRRGAPSGGTVQGVIISYTIPSTGARIHNFRIQLTTVPLPWGGLKYFFLYPECERRVSISYLPPGCDNFRCRSCYDLTYESSQRAHCYDLWVDICANVAAEHEERKRELLADIPDRYEGYLSREELCEASGLSDRELELLDNAHLLLPDHEGKYRPKLTGWAHKLKYLLDHNWSIAEVQVWAKNRWKMTNPRLWPPRKTRD